MTWRTHIAVGANALWVVGFLGRVDESILVLLPVAVVASLLPDIDATSAKIHYAGGGVLGIFRNSFHGKYFHHRGLMHSFLVTASWFLLLHLIFYRSYPYLSLVFALSYLSHSIIDGFNTNVGYFYPFVHKRFALLPRSLLSRVGGGMDKLLFFLGLFGLLLFFWMFQGYLLQNGH